MSKTEAGARKGASSRPQKSGSRGRLARSNDRAYFLMAMALPTTAVVMAYTTIQSFRAFDLIYAMTQGGPNNSSSILVTLIYLTAFNEYRFGYAATQSIYLIVFILVLTAVQRRVLRTRY